MVHSFFPYYYNNFFPAISPKVVEYTDPSIPSPESREIELHMNTVSPVMLDEAVRRIVQAVHPEQILLFGSQAWGQPTADSDIDLLVILGASDQPGYRHAREVYRSLQGLQLPIEVLVRTRAEVTRAAQCATSLERQALDHGRVLHG